MNDILYDYSKKTTTAFVGFLLLYECCVYISNDMIMPGMIAVVKTFHASNDAIALSLTLFILGGSSLQLIIGPLSDRLGRKPVMLFGVLLFLLTTLYIAHSASIQQFLWARFFQGMGLCFISVIGYSALQEMFAEMYAVRIVSIMSNITILAPLAGPLLGAIVIQYYPWPVIFHIISIAALIALIGLSFFMPETVNRPRRDGSYLAITSVKLPVIFKNYLRLFQNRQFIIGSIACGLMSVPIIAWIGSAPLILIEKAHLTTMTYAWLQLPIFSGVALGAYFMRRLTFHWDLQAIIRLGSQLMVAGLLLAVLLVVLLKREYLGIIIGFSVYAFGAGVAGAGINRVTLFSTEVPKGTASAILSLLTMVIMALGNQGAGYSYSHLNDLYFTAFCAAAGIAYYLAARYMFNDLSVKNINDA